MVGRYWFLYKKSMDEKINERDQNSGIIGTLFMGSAVLSQWSPIPNIYQRMIHIYNVFWYFDTRYQLSEKV